MGAQHTPGPWEIRDSEVLGGPFGYCIDTDSFVVAEVYDDATELPALANARLIAAAPEMLEALYQYVSDLRFPPQGDSIQRRIERAEAVIAKATGGAA
jgi:hypothetical protein